MREKISACVTTFNEETNIRRCLASLAWCDEIIVVDSFSTYRTVAICREFTDRIYQHAWLGYIGQIRVAPGFRGTWLVQRGAPCFRQASAPGLGYMGVIASDNPRARKVLAGPRLPAGLHARLMTGMTTCAILLRRTDSRPARGLDLQPASAASLPEVIAFLQQHGPSVVLVDVNKEVKVETEQFFSKGKNTPFEGWVLKGMPVMTTCKGKIYE